MPYFVYILTNKKHGTLYTGVTNNLARRIFEHKSGVVEGFTKKYALKNLVYYEIYEDVRDTLAREKLIKKWKRTFKIDAINKTNPNWIDLYNNL